MHQKALKKGKKVTKKIFSSSKKSKKQAKNDCF